jgi:hypothetical protein
MAARSKAEAILDRVARPSVYASDAEVLKPRTLGREVGSCTGYKTIIMGAGKRSLDFFIGKIRGRGYLFFCS